MGEEEGLKCVWESQKVICFSSLMNLCSKRELCLYFIFRLLKKSKMSTMPRSPFTFLKFTAITQRLKVDRYKEKGKMKYLVPFVVFRDVMKICMKVT